MSDTQALLRPLLQRKPAGLELLKDRAVAMRRTGAAHQADTGLGLAAGGGEEQVAQGDIAANDRRLANRPAAAPVLWQTESCCRRFTNL